MKPSKREKKTFSSGRFFKPRISKQFIRAAAQEGERLVIRRSLVRIPSACRSVLEQDTEPQTAPDEHEFESCFGQKHLLNVSEKLLWEPLYHFTDRTDLKDDRKQEEWHAGTGRDSNPRLLQRGQHLGTRDATRPPESLKEFSRIFLFFGFEITIYHTWMRQSEKEKLFFVKLKIL